MTQYDVYAIGNALVDMEYETSDATLHALSVNKGEMTLIDANQQGQLIRALAEQGTFRKRACGGSAANTAIAVAGLGGKAFYSCNVAADETGDFFMADLHTIGVDSNLGPLRAEGISGKCVVMVTPDAERTMQTYLGISAEISTAQLNPTALAASQYLYIEGYLVTSPSACLAIAQAKQIARTAGVKIAFTLSDPAMVQFFKTGLSELIGDGVDILFCNQVEASLFTGENTPLAALAALKPLAKTIVLTCGSQGALLFDGENTLHIAAQAITPIDSNGAGDNFAGAFLYALTHGYTWEAAGQLASRVAAQVISQFGPRLSAQEYADFVG